MVCQRLIFFLAVAEAGYARGAFIDPNSIGASAAQALLEANSIANKSNAW